MKQYFLNKYFDEEAIEDFLSFVNEHGNPNIIYLNSVGGETWVSTFFADYINENNIQVVTNHYVYSAALTLLLKVKKDLITISDDSTGLIHQGSYQIEKKDSGRNSTNLEDIYKYNIANVYNHDKDFKRVLSKEDFEQYLNGDDVYINAEQLRQLVFGDENSVAYIDANTSNTSEVSLINPTDVAPFDNFLHYYTNEPCTYQVKGYYINDKLEIKESNTCSIRDESYVKPNGDRMDNNCYYVGFNRMWWTSNKEEAIKVQNELIEINRVKINLQKQYLENLLK